MIRIILKLMRAKRQSCHGTNVPRKSAFLVHPAHVCAGDPVDTALGEQGLGEQVAGHDVAAALQVHAAHAEVAQLVLVGDPDDLRLVAHLAGSQLEFEVGDVLETTVTVSSRPSHFLA
jgi:hypothetical protein